MIRKRIENTLYMNNDWKDDRSRKYMPEERLQNDFDKVYVLDDRYKLIPIVIMGKAGRM